MVTPVVAMIWLTEPERVTLVVLGASALAGLGLLGWQQRRPPITVEAGTTVAAQWDAQVRASKVVDLNTATVEELERLPDIGPSTAKRIVDYRQQHGRFRRVEELLDVQGIGPKTLEKITEVVSVR